MLVVAAICFLAFVCVHVDAMSPSFAPKMAPEGAPMMPPVGSPMTPPPVIASPPMMGPKMSPGTYFDRNAGNFAARLSLAALLVFSIHVVHFYGTANDSNCDDLLCIVVAVSFMFYLSVNKPDCLSSAMEILVFGERYRCLAVWMFFFWVELEGLSAMTSFLTCLSCVVV